MQDVALGQIVQSKAGRDKDRYFIVIGIADKDYVLLADGDVRKIGSPKKKKTKHLVIHYKFAETIRKMLVENCRITDSDLRKSLESLGLMV